MAHAKVFRRMSFELVMKIFIVTLARSIILFAGLGEVAGKIIGIRTDDSLDHRKNHQLVRFALASFRSFFFLSNFRHSFPCGFGRRISLMNIFSLSCRGSITTWTFSRIDRLCLFLRRPTSK